MTRAKVLLAEDDPAVLQALQRILHQQGEFETESAVDGLRAWDKVRSWRPDLIVSDYAMPGLNGFELCKRVKAHPDHSGVMFVVLTGFTETRMKVTGLTLGVDDYLTKPVEAPEFLAKIRAALRLKTLHDELRKDKEELQQVHQQLGRSFDHLLSILLHLMDLKIPGASVRGELLAARARAMAMRMGVPSKFLYDLELAARLWEMGKLVDQPDTGSAESQWHVFVLSKAVLEQVDAFKGAASVVGTIGEHWDGTGQPDHLLQGQIPLRSRILRLLIDLSSLCTGTASSPACTVQDALAKLRQYAGTRYDPLVVTHLEQMIKESKSEAWRPQKHRVPLNQLADGMVLAEDLCTSSGVKLLSRGAKLTSNTLELIIRRHSSDPILYGACVES